jgi:chlorophyll synthase
MTLNDFKSLDGDRVNGIRSIPVQLGADRAAKLACATMALPQLAMVALLVYWQAPYHAGALAALLAIQLVLMRRLLQRPRELAPWYNATGITLYVAGMMLSSFAIAGVSS